MKTTLCLLTAGLLPVAIGQVPQVAQQPDPLMTLGRYNGRAWLKMGQSLKLGYLSGYCDGVRSTVAEGGPSYVAATNTFKALIPLSTDGDMVDFLDTFFKTPENRPLPIGLALRVFAIKLKGASEAEINALLAVLREQVSKP